MTWLSNNAPGNLICELQEKFGIRLAIETGTYTGQSTFFLAKRFKGVITIDINEKFQKLAIMEHGLPNVSFLVGDSREKLPFIMKQINEPCIFWLDAHQTFQNYGEVPDDCPILEEIETIISHHYQHFILADDINTFLPIDKRKREVPGELQNWVAINQIKKLIDMYGYKCKANLKEDTFTILPKQHISLCDAYFKDDV